MSRRNIQQPRRPGEARKLVTVDRRLQVARDPSEGRCFNDLKAGYAEGGTGQIERQPALDALTIAAEATAAEALISDGTSASFGQLDLTAGVTGVLPLANGGTGSNASVDSTEARQNLQANHVEILNKAADYTAVGSDEAIRCDTTSAAITITLPSAVEDSGKPYRIKNVGTTSYDVTIATDGSETIFTTSAVSTVTLSPGDAVILISNGANWDSW